MQVSLEDVNSLIIEKLKAGGSIIFTPKGKSMLPLLSDGKDEVILQKPPYRLKKRDVALYKRKSGEFVLHRLVGIKDEIYIMRGDNQISKEYGISHDQIIAVMVGYKRKGKEKTINSFSYKMYIFYLTIRFPFKYFFTRLKNLIWKIFKK